MSPFLQFLAAVGTTFFAQNLVLSRAFGASELLSLARERKKLGAVCLSIVILSVAGCLFTRLIASRAAAPLLPLFYLTALFVLYVLTALAVIRLKTGPAFLRALRPVVFGSALAGTMLLAAGKGVTLPTALGLGLGGGLGFCLALFYTLQAQRHFAESNVPKPFQGLPVSLLYLGLLSLAFYGILGSGLSA